jgi:hypothetical protein
MGSPRAGRSSRRGGGSARGDHHRDRADRRRRLGTLPARGVGRGPGERAAQDGGGHHPEEPAVGARRDPGALEAGGPVGRRRGCARHTALPGGCRDGRTDRELGEPAPGPGSDAIAVERFAPSVPYITSTTHYILQHISTINPNSRGIDPSVREDSLQPVTPTARASTQGDLDAGLRSAMSRSLDPARAESPDQTNSTAVSHSLGGSPAPSSGSTASPSTCPEPR